MWYLCPIAGVGTRLQPFTYSKPKAFIKVAGKKLIDHILIKLQKSFLEGINLCFIVGYKKRQIREYLSDNYGKYFNLTFIEQEPRGYNAEEPFFSGLGDAILLAKDRVKGDDCFIFLSDRLPLEEYSSILLKYQQGQYDGIINVQKVKDPQYYGVVSLDEKKCISKIVEKPKKSVSKLAVSGVYLFGKSVTPRLFELLEDQSQIDIKNGMEHQLTPVIEQLIEEGFRIGIHEMKSPVLDFGRPENLLEGNRYLLSELKTSDPLYESLTQKGNIRDTKIIPPVYIGENVQISDSIIGPNVSIGDNLKIEKSILSESVIGDGVCLKKIISSESIIGDYSILEDLIKEKITVGDSTFITTTNMKIK
jgi:glucose-1-phosphate thymidylyltransferase